MAGEIHHRHVGAAGGVSERDQAASHLVKAAIGDQRDRETEPFQCRGKVAGIIRRIWQRRHTFVSAVADHQRHPPVVGCAARRGEARQRCRGSQT